MNNFKSLLLQIASLSRKDQNWIMHSLSKTHQYQFQNLQGPGLLAEARRFGKYQMETPAKSKIVKLELPLFYKTLSHKPGLFVALILKQGQFSSEQHFLYLNPEHALPFFQNRIKRIKPATQKILFDHWQKTLPEISSQEAPHAATV